MDNSDFLLAFAATVFVSLAIVPAAAIWRGYADRKQARTLKAWRARQERRAEIARLEARINNLEMRADSSIHRERVNLQAMNDLLGRIALLEAAQTVATEIEMDRIDISEITLPSEPVSEPEREYEPVTLTRGVIWRSSENA